MLVLVNPKYKLSKYGGLFTVLEEELLTVYVDILMKGKYTLINGFQKLNYIKMIYNVE